MRNTITPTAVEAFVLRQAADVVSEAVRDALVAALRAAEVCGCRSCRAAAPRTFLWASALQPAAGEREQPSLEVSSPPRSREDATRFPA
jgi:hypothetical protein